MLCYNICQIGVVSSRYWNYINLMLLPLQSLNLKPVKYRIEIFGPAIIKIQNDCISFRRKVLHFLKFHRFLELMHMCIKMVLAEDSGKKPYYDAFNFFPLDLSQFNQVKKWINDLKKKIFRSMMNKRHRKKRQKSRSNWWTITSVSQIMSW